jgi:D-erythro-7,8-dihydroneopterin triphosphate epimerase
VIIRIKNLRLRAIIGVNEWERKERQAVIVNAELQFDGARAIVSDNLEDTIDYRTISRRLIEHTENSEYLLIEALAGNLLKVCLDDPRVERARIEVDKPNATRSADSTSIEVEGVRE